MTHDLPRRHVLALMSAAAALAAAPARALSEGAARDLVVALVDDINAVIESGQSEAQMLRAFERIFVAYADVPTVARYSLGVAARSAPPAQLDRYVAAFQTYVARKYGRRFREFIGGRLEVNEAREVKSFIEVRTTAYLRGADPMEVSFLVSDRSGSLKFFNMFIEGVNMLLTERTEIGAILDRRGGDIDALIADLSKV